MSVDDERLRENKLGFAVTAINRYILLAELWGGRPMQDEEHQHGRCDSV